MKILMIAPTPFFADRGCHVRIYEEIKALQDLGHEIVLCTYGIGRDVPNVNIVRTYNPFWYKKLSAGPSYTKILLLFALLFTTIKTAWSFRPDLFHCFLHEGALIGRLCRLIFWRMPMVFDCQGSLTSELLQHGFFPKLSLRHKFFRFIEGIIVHWFPVVVSSGNLVNELTEMGVAKNRIVFVGDGVDTDVFNGGEFDFELANELGIVPDKPRVLYVGLLEKYQGTDVMLEAFSHVVEKHPDTQFIIIGYPNEDEYVTRARELGIGSNCKFLGRIDYNQLPRYLTLAKIAVAPKISKTEGDGKLYNYMAASMAIVAFDREVSRQILADTAMFATFNDARSLAEKLSQLITCKEDCEKLGQAARERAIKELSWQAVSNRIEDLYERLMKDE